MFRNIIWDVDGTLFDTYPPIAKAIKAALNDLGKDASLKWIEGLCRESLGHCVKLLSDTYELEEDDIEREFQRHYAFVSAEESPPFPGVVALCDYIVMSGGKNIIVTHRGREGTLELLAAHNLTDYFSRWVERDDGYARKPDPAAFEAAIGKYNLELEETLTVGDREIDILAGQRAGIFSCFFGSSSIDTEADLVVSNFDDLYQYIVSGSRQNIVMNNG